MTRALETSSTMKRKERSSKSPGAAMESKKKKPKTETSSKLNFDTPEKVFESLLSPTNLDTFFSEFWEQKPLVIKRRDAEFYGDLFLKKHLEDILKKHKLQYEEDVNVCRYVNGKKELRNKEGRATFAKIQKDFKSSGATLQFHQPQRFKDEMWQLNEALERFFGCLVGANVYITPSQSQGLAPHYDDVEVFILQLEGKKHWKLYKPLVELPQDYSPDLEREHIGDPTHEFDLEQGDLLYFPRGTAHEAEVIVDGEHSTHVTISTYQNNSWGDLLMSSVSEDNIERAMKNDLEFRRGLPINYRSYMGYQYVHEDHQDCPAVNGLETEQKVQEKKQQEFNSHLGTLMGRLANHFDPHKAADGLAFDFMSSRLPPFAVSGETTKTGKEEDVSPTDESSIRLLYRDHMRLLLVQKPTRAVGVDDASDDENDEEEQSDEMSVDEESSDEMEEGEESSNKKSKSREWKKERKGNKNAGGQMDGEELEGEAEDENEEEEEDEEIDKQKKPANKKMKSEGEKQDRKVTKTSGGKKDEDKKEEEQQAEEEKSAKNNTPRGNKKGGDEEVDEKEEQSEEDEDEDEEKGGEEEEEEEEEEEKEEDEDDDDDDEWKEWVVVSHSLKNDRTRHMIGEQEPVAIKFPLLCRNALRYILSRPGEYIPVSALPLPEEERVALVTSLWAERLIEVKKAQ